MQRWNFRKFLFKNTRPNQSYSLCFPSISNIFVVLHLVLFTGLTDFYVIFSEKYWVLPKKKKTYFENFKNCFLNGQGNYEIIMIYSRVIEY